VAPPGDEQLSREAAISTPVGVFWLGLDRAGELRSGWGSTRSAPPALSPPPEILRRWATEWLAGATTSPPPPVALPPGTPFERRCWQALLGIPSGETRTYGVLAAQIGAPGAARAVGRAMGRNPLPLLLPCHRVVGVRGLGGYCGGSEAGRRIKRFLAALEGPRSAPDCGGVLNLSPSIADPPIESSGVPSIPFREPQEPPR